MTDVRCVYAIDDDETVVRSIQAVLGQHGYVVECFLSAQEFLNRADPNGPGCVVTDLQMPGVNGLELQQRLLAANSPIAAVFVSGVADVVTTVKLMERGAVTLLEKPYDHAQLLAAVERGLAMSQEKWLRLQAELFVEQRLATLTADESRVLEQMLTGDANKLVALRLDMSLRTVDRRRQSVLAKMGVRSVPELAVMLGNGLSTVRHEIREIVPERTF